MSPALVITTALGWLALLFAVAAWADRRARAGRSVIDNAAVYALSMGVYCTAWTYFGSVGRAATAGPWFLPIYLGPTLAMVLAWLVLRKMVRIARREHISSIADFIASRYGKSQALAGAVTLVALVGVVPYVALQLKAVAGAFAVLTGSGAAAAAGPWWRDGTLGVALLLAGFTIAFGTRTLDATERHEGLVAAVALESVVKLVAFMAVGLFVTFGLFGGPAELFEQAWARPELARVIAPPAMDWSAWATLVLLAALALLLLPRQFQVMVVENVRESHLRRAAWAFPLYLLLINLFVLPIALGGLLAAPAGSNPENFVLTLPLAAGHAWLALAAFVGGLSAATGMVIVETIAVATMVCNDLVLPLLLRRGSPARPPRARTLLRVRRAAIVVLLLLGYAYYRMAGEAYALVSIGLISFAAVAQFAPALLGGLYWKGGTRNGALAGLVAGALLWAWTLLLPSFARSGWMDGGFVQHGPWGIAWLRPEALLGLSGLDNLTHALWWSLLVNTALYVGVSLRAPPRAAEASQALRFVDALEPRGTQPVFWRGRADAATLHALLARFVGVARADAQFDAHAQRQGLPGRHGLRADAALVNSVEGQLAAAVGGAAARVMVASVVEEEALELADVMRIVEEARELRDVNEKLQSLDRLKDDFMSSVTHELRTPLTSIRAMAEMLQDDPAMPAAQREQFLGIVVSESERLSRLVNQVLDLAKIEAGHAEWRLAPVDLAALAHQAALSLRQGLAEQGVSLVLELPAPGDTPVPSLQADPDRLLQVLLNLLANAAKFARRPDGHVHLAVSGRAPDAGAPHGRVRVSICDDGPGVQAAQRELIFEKFRQGGQARQRPQGTGLGLPISRQIVEHFGGRLWLATDDAPRPLPGACFVFELPVGTPPEESLLCGDSSTPLGGRAGMAGPGGAQFTPPIHHKE